MVTVISTKSSNRRNRFKPAPPKNNRHRERDNAARLGIKISLEKITTPRTEELRSRKLEGLEGETEAADKRGNVFTGMVVHRGHEGAANSRETRTNKLFIYNFRRFSAIAKTQQRWPTLRMNTRRECSPLVRLVFQIHSRGTSA